MRRSLVAAMALAGLACVLAGCGQHQQREIGQRSFGPGTPGAGVGRNTPGAGQNGAPPGRGTPGTPAAAGDNSTEPRGGR